MPEESDQGLLVVASWRLSQPSAHTVHYAGARGRAPSPGRRPSRLLSQMGTRGPRDE